jgi:hypothetical protein
LVPVGELADPASLEMGDTAPAGVGGVEVDVAVVQVQALSRTVPDLHCVPPIHIHTGFVPLSSIVSPEDVAIDWRGRRR